MAAAGKQERAASWGKNTGETPQTKDIQD